MLAIVQFAYVAAILTATGGPWAFVLVAGVAAVSKLRKGRPLWKHGQARFCTAAELRERAMLDGDKGLMIGRLGDASRPTLTQAVGPLFNQRVSSRAACGQFLSLFDKNPPVVRLADAIHVAVFSRTGGGKGQSFIVPWLRECNQSAVILDFGGENAKLTASYRERRFGQRVELVDPWRLVTETPATINPVDSIKREAPDALDLANDISNEIVVETGNEKDPFFNKASRMWIAGSIAATVQWGASNERSLQTVANMLSGPERLKKLVAALCEGPGALPRFGGQLAHFEGKTLASTLAVASSHLQFLNTPAVAESTSSSSFDPMALRKERITVYLIVPVEHALAQMGLLRTWLGTLTRAAIRGGLERV
jgi:type IV secretion system protein VirD4